MNTFLKKILPYVGMFVVVVVVCYFAKRNHDNFEKNIIDKAGHQLLSTVHSEALLLNQHVLNLTQELEILSQDEFVQEAFSYRNLKAKEESFSLLDDSYKDIQFLADSLSMLDAKGAVIYEVPSKGNMGKDISAKADVQSELIDHHAQASGIISESSGPPVLTFDEPVFKQGTFVGFLRAVINLETLHAIASRYEKGERYSFLLDQEDRLLSYPDRRYLGQSLLTLFQDNRLLPAKGRFEALMKKINGGGEGTGTCQLFSLDNPYKAEEVIVAFSPVSFDGKKWSLVSVIGYDTIAGPVKKNARDNIFFAGFVIFVLSCSAAVLYWDQKRKNYELQRLYENLTKNMEELKSTQSLLIQSAKMEVVGKLAAGVAHEVKNPLAVILMGVGYLKNNVKSSDEHVPVFLDDIENAVNRADTIVKGLLDFSSTSKLEITRQDIHALIDKSLLLAKHIMRKNKVHVVKDFGEGIPAVAVDKNKVEQVFVNLFMNAVEAMPFGGELRVKTSLEGSSDTQDRVVIQIEDAGSGISENILNDLFAPFVTTKRATGGTGMGLLIVKNIMEMHGGRIALENKAEGQGARAILWFKIGGDV